MEINNGQTVTIQKEASVVETARPEQRTRVEILAEVQKLGLDTRYAIDASGVGDDHTLGVINEAMLKRSMADTQAAIGLQDWYNFDPTTGVALPGLKMEEIKFSDGTVLKGGIDKESYRQRLAAVKALLGQRVQDAQINGKQIPESDPLTGQRITSDSLAAYDSVFNPDKWRTRQETRPLQIESSANRVIQGGPLLPDQGPVSIVRTQIIK